MTTSKDKAIELVNSFLPFTDTETNTVAINQNAKKCALICIQELYDADYPGYPSQAEYDKWSLFLEDVKREIVKL